MLPNRFTNLTPLDAGGFATVLSAFDVELGDVAIKSPNSRAVDVISRFHREVELQSELTHSNIAEVLDFDLECEPPWYAMALAEGNLARALTDQRWDAAGLVGFFRDVLSGVGHAHAQHVLHRDLKPGNVLIYVEPGGVAVARIADFGLSRRFTRDRMPFQTRTAYASGTDYFTAPEQWSEFRDATVTADVFSLGRILEYMLASRVSLMASYSQLQDCVRIATRFDPLERYESVEQFSVAIELALLDSEQGLTAQEVVARAVRMFLESVDDQIPLDRLMDALEKYERQAPALRLAFARIPEEAIDTLCLKHAGRFRSVLLSLVTFEEEPEPVDSAMRTRNLLERCLDSGTDPRLHGIALFGLARLATTYGMREFSDPALHRLYSYDDPSALVELRSLLARHEDVKSWVQANIDPTRSPMLGEDV